LRYFPELTRSEQEKHTWRTTRHASWWAALK